MKKYFNLFFQALRGEEYNYTEISINKAIFLLSIPMIFEMVGEALFAVVDVFFVSRISIEAVATVGLTESVLSLVYSVAIGLSAAATAIVARRVGEGNPIKAGESVAQVIIISLVLAVFVGIAGFVCAEDILRLMGGNETLIAKGSNFTRIIFASSPAIMLLYTLSGALRGAGDASTAMRSLLLANAFNIVLDAVLLIGLHFGVEGAAIATTIGRSIGVIYQLYKLLQGNGNIKITAEQFKPNLEIIKNLLGIAAGGAGQFMIASASWIFLTRILSSFGSDVVGGYTIAIRVIIFTILPSWGMANAAATLVGQNLGAGKPDRAETSVWRASYINTIFLCLVAVCFFIFADSIIGIFNTNPKVLETGILCLRVVCLGYLGFGFGMVISQALNGAGDTKTPTILNLIGFWLIQIPLAYFLALTLNWGSLGVFISIAFADTVLAVLAIWVFRKGKWKTMKV